MRCGSSALRGASWLRLADEAICIGPAAAGRSYLHIPSIIAAAEIADVEAIHPGYGFLAENAHFADVCRSCQIAFIGPPVEAMEALGDKSRARGSMALEREKGRDRGGKDGLGLDKRGRDSEIPT